MLCSCNGMFELLSPFNYKTKKQKKTKICQKQTNKCFSSQKCNGKITIKQLLVKLFGKTSQTALIKIAIIFCTTYFASYEHGLIIAVKIIVNATDNCLSTYFQKPIRLR